MVRQPADAPSELFEAFDILCPNRPMWFREGPDFASFYRDQQSRGRTLQFYSCSGPARLLDPYSYYRLQAWHCWKIGATGESSLQTPSSGLPYTAAVEEKTKWRTPASSQHCNRFRVATGLLS